MQDSYENDSDITPEVKNSAEFYVRTIFFAGGIIHLYQLWFRGETDLSLNNMSLKICQFVAISTNNFLMLQEGLSTSVIELTVYFMLLYIFHMFQ